MPDQRKYIISAFLILAVVFVGVYIAGYIFQKPGECAIVDSLGYTNMDTSKKYNDGKIIFQNQCAACHIFNQDGTGPNLAGFTERGPWTDKKKILDYLADPNKFLKENKSKYVVDLYNSTPFTKPAFQISEEQLDALIDYLRMWDKPDS